MCSGYGIGFDLRSEFLLIDNRLGKNVIIFGADMCSSVHMDNKRKNLLILGKGPTQIQNDTTLTAEAQYSIKFSRSNRKLYLNLHYIGSKSFLFLNATKTISIQIKRYY